MKMPQDPSGLAAEANAFRYRPLRSVLVCVGAAAAESDVAMARAAGATVGARVEVGGEVEVLAAAAKAGRRAGPGQGPVPRWRLRPDQTGRG